MTDCGCHSHNGFLRAKGLKEAAQQRSLEGLRPLSDLLIFDTVGSVSALGEGEEFHVWDGQLLEEQHRRFHNGS